MKMDFRLKKLGLVCAVIALGLTTGCASKKWSTSPDGRSVASEQNVIKTPWGSVKVTPNKTNDDGMWFEIEVANQSKQPVKYQRSFITLTDEQGNGYSDVQAKHMAENAANTGISAAKSGWGLGSLLGAAKTLNQARKALTNNAIDPSQTHTDDLIYDKRAAKGNIIRIKFSPEFVGKEAAAQTITFYAGK